MYHPPKSRGATYFVFSTTGNEGIAAYGIRQLFPFPMTKEPLPLGVIVLRAEANIVDIVLCRNVMSRPAVRQSKCMNNSQLPMSWSQERPLAVDSCSLSRL